MATNDFKPNRNETWNYFQWKEGIRKSGIMKLLKPSALRVLFFADLHVSRRPTTAGEVDLPQQYMALVTGVARKTIKRGIDELETLGILKPIGKSRRDKRVVRYRLSQPKNLFIHGDYEDQADSAAPNRQQNCGHLCPHKGTGVSEDQDTHDAQTIKQTNKQNSNSEIMPTAEQNAAAAILKSIGFTDFVSGRLVEIHKLSRSEARNIRAHLNAKAKLGYEVRSPTGLATKLLHDNERGVSKDFLKRIDQRASTARKRAVKQLAKEQSNRRHREQEERAKLSRSMKDFLIKKSYCWSVA